MRSRRSRYAAVAMLLTLVAGAAWAHASLIRSDPAPDAHLAQAPATIQLEFNEAVLARTSRVELVAPDSQRLSLAVHNDSTNAKLLVADVPTLTSHGRFRVEWRLVGPDGHAVTGRYSFSIDSSAVRDTTAAPDTSATPETTRAATSQTTGVTANGTLSGVLRFLTTLGITLIVGATAFMLLVLPRVRTSRTSIGLYHSVVEERVRTVAWWCAITLLPALLAREVSQGAALGGSLLGIKATDLAAITATSWGRALMVSTAAMVLILVMLRRPRRGTGRTSWPGVGAACIVMACAAPFLGHPAAADAAGVAITLDAIHVLAAGGWAGVIMTIGLVALPVTVRAQMDDRVLMIKSLLAAFTPVALTCAGLLAVTGTGEALLQLGHVSALWQTPYGLGLIRKLVLVTGVAILGAWHWRVGQATLARARSITALRWSMILDVVVVIGVIVLTAVLTGTPTPTE